MNINEHNIQQLIFLSDLNVPNCFPVFISHTAMRQSAPPVARNLSSGLNARQRT